MNDMLSEHSIRSVRKKRNVFEICINKRRYLHIFCIGLIFALLSGCGGNSISELPQPIGEEITDNGGPNLTAAPEEFAEGNLLNGTPIVGIREVKDGMYQSYLTGEWKDADVALRRPFGLIIPNNRAALPQYGISAASVVFEAPVEFRMTRLLAIVEDYDDLDRIGPTRSARDYFIYEAMGREAIFCHWGLTIIYCAHLINSDRIDNISNPMPGVNVGSGAAFKRITRPGYVTEFTGYMVIDGYTESVSRLNYNPTYSSDFIPQFVFAAENTRVEYEGHPDATIIRPGGTTNNRSGYGNGNPYFEYNKEDGLYYRYQLDAKHIDEMNNQQLAYSNVIFQYVYGEVREPVAEDYLIFQVHDEGNPAKVFTNGKVIEGTWRRLRDSEPARFYCEDGFEIVLNQGKTWICMIWDEYSEFAEYN